MLRMDNGPEFISLALAEWAEKHAVKLEFIQPGKPTQNAFIERFNRTYRTEILDFYLFRTLNEVREITEKWLSEYNGKRPHESLNNMMQEESRQHHYLAGSSKMPGTKKGLFTVVSGSYFISHYPLKITYGFRQRTCRTTISLII